MTLTRAEIEANLKFNRYAFKIVKEILSVNDKALVANLLDQSKKIIVDVNSIISLIEYAIDAIVDIETDAEAHTCKCGACKAHMFETITSITIGGKSLRKAEPELYSYIVDELCISLSKTYASDVFKIEKNEATVEVGEEDESEETCE